LHFEAIMAEAADPCLDLEEERDSLRDELQFVTSNIYAVYCFDAICFCQKHFY
jgi:hypothetical protein